MNDRTSKPLACPWCGVWPINGAPNRLETRFSLGCVNQSCEVQPLVQAQTSDECVHIWNKRTPDETSALPKLEFNEHCSCCTRNKITVEVFARPAVEPTPSPVCTCTPSKFEATAWGGTMTSAVIDPNCPLHWRQMLIQNSSPEKASERPRYSCGMQGCPGDHADLASFCSAGDNDK